MAYDPKCARNFFHRPAHAAATEGYDTAGMGGLLAPDTPRPKVRGPLAWGPPPGPCRTAPTTTTSHAHTLRPCRQPTCVLRRAHTPCIDVVGVGPHGA